MLKTSLISLLKSLNNEELHSFEDLVKSPYFNKNTAVVNLFIYLKSFHTNFSETEKLNRRNIYKIMFPDKSYNIGVMKNIIWELNLLGEKFLELTHYNENKTEQYRHLLFELTGRNLNKSFKKNLKKAELILHKEKGGDIYFRNKMDLELLKFNYDLKNLGRTEKYKFDSGASRYLILYFLTKFFKINYNNMVQMLNFGKVEHIDFLDEVLSYIGKNPEIDPVIFLYFYKFMLMYKEDETSYEKFKQLVREQIKNLDRKELYNTYINLLNYCYNKIASGESDFSNDLFEIYNEMIDNNIITISEQDYLDTMHFRLAVETAVKLKEFDWAKRFIDKYSEKLPPHLRRNEINIALANYSLLKKNYDEAQKHLAQIQLHSVYDKVYIYVFQSMLYYETKRFENLISEDDAIIHFITNDKILAMESKNRFRKYVKYLDELIKLNTREHKDIDLVISQIKEKLISDSDILEKAWLLEKLNEMITI